MFNDPLAVLTVLLVIEGGILLLAEHSATKAAFKYLPSMFWIYFLPMLANSAGLIPAQSEVYGAISKHLLPACLVLMLLSVDMRAIVKLGPIALGVMLAGSLGTLVGGPVVLAMFKHWLPADMWMGFGSLSASWIGGSANMIAVKQSIEAPDRVFLPMVVVDTIVPYVWMGVLILLAGYQKWYDRWNHSRAGLIDDLARRSQVNQVQAQPISLMHIVLMFALAGAATLASLRLAGALPVVKGVITPSAWAIILATAIGLCVSFTPARRLETYGASKLGYGMLYLILASIGAQTNLTHITEAPILLVAGAVWILIHGGFIVLAGRLLRAPMGLIAAASQANIGGPASAPVVGGIYHPALAPVALLLAILGNIIGTYLGLACCQMCKYVAST